jgi:short-subunit dehydrogenase
MPVTPLIGTVEEASEADVRALFDTNYFWMLRVVQAALPLLRQQGGGNILGVSSGMGIVAVPLIGFYCASNGRSKCSTKVSRKRSRALASR